MEQDLQIDLDRLENELNQKDQKIEEQRRNNQLRKIVKRCLEQEIEAALFEHNSNREWKNFLER